MIPKEYKATIYVQISPDNPNPSITECQGEGLIEGYVTLGQMDIVIPLSYSDEYLTKLCSGIDSQIE